MVKEYSCLIGIIILMDLNIFTAHNFLLCVVFFIQINQFIALFELL
ncbi:putative membrane protein [Acinetobacter sp. 1294596]|nr:putative membrane protein [Acinetobacter sp. 1294596]